MGSNISKGKKWKQRNDGGDPNSFSGVQSKFSKAVVAAVFFDYFPFGLLLSFGKENKFSLLSLLAKSSTVGRK